MSLQLDNNSTFSLWYSLWKLGPSPPPHEVYVPPHEPPLINTLSSCTCPPYGGEEGQIPLCVNDLGKTLLGDTMSMLGGYHDECWGMSWVHRGCSIHLGFYTNSIVFPMTSPTFIMISLWCTHDIPPVYWISTVVLHTPGVLYRHYAGCWLE